MQPAHWLPPRIRITRTLATSGRSSWRSSFLAIGVPSVSDERAARVPPPQVEPEDVDGSPFPAQCTFDIVEEFAPVPEAEFRHILEYTERQRFKFKLSRWQCRDLLETMCSYDAKQRARRLYEELALN